MPKLPGISDAEWAVMQTLWAESPLTAAGVVQRLQGRTGWSPRTIKTLLGRLVRKGALKFSEDGNRYQYRPAVSRDACIREESRSFLQRVFGGDVAPMLAHFVRDNRLTPDQIRELRKLLERKGEP